MSLFFNGFFGKYVTPTLGLGRSMQLGKLRRSGHRAYHFERLQFILKCGCNKVDTAVNVKFRQKEAPKTRLLHFQ